MSQPNETPIIIAGFVLLAAVLGGGYYLFDQLSDKRSIAPKDHASPAVAQAFPLPTRLPAGLVVRLNGSTSMKAMDRQLKAGFEASFPGTTVNIATESSTRGLEDLRNNRADVAGVSRSLSPNEIQDRIVTVPIARDSIAVVVNRINPWKGQLSSQQVIDIFQGKIRNWSELGGPNRPLRIVHRSPDSGTRESFQSLALSRGTFLTGDWVTTLDRDSVVELIQALGMDGIGYISAEQIRSQPTLRAIPIDQKAPDHLSYPYQRFLSYAYQNPPNPAAQAFLGYVLSSQGQGQLLQSDSAPKTDD